MLMSVLTQAYRTTCIPKASRIPFEEEELEYNEETLAAMQEALDIVDGKIKTKQYSTVEEMHADIDAEEDEDA